MECVAHDAARAGNPKLSEFCNACFTGDYPTGDITVERLKVIESERHSHGDKVPVHWISGATTDGVATESLAPRLTAGD